MSSRIWHNPRCGTSRNVLALLQAAGEAPEVILYLETGWQEAGLRQLLQAAGLSPRQALRVKGTSAEARGLTAPEAGEDQIIAAMLEDPVLVERPFVATAKGTALCRPSLSLLPLLARLPEAIVTDAAGKVIYDPSASEN